MCALVANSDEKQRWLRSAGLLPALHRLTLGSSPQALPGVGDDVAGGGGGAGALPGPAGQDLSPHVQRACARLLAILAAHEDALVGPWAAVALRALLSLVAPGVGACCR